MSIRASVKTPVQQDQVLNLVIRARFFHRIFRFTKCIKSHQNGIEFITVQLRVVHCKNINILILDFLHKYELI